MIKEINPNKLEKIYDTLFDNLLVSFIAIFNFGNDSHRKIRQIKEKYIKY